jgi:type IV pilus assembly protein PilF
MQLGIIYEQQGEKTEALNQYNLALRADKKSVAAMSALGTNAFEEGDYKNAEKWFKRALKINPDDLLSNNNLAMIYLTQERKLDEAEQHANKALSSPLRPYAEDTLNQIQAKRHR